VKVCEVCGRKEFLWNSGSCFRDLPVRLLCIKCRHERFTIPQGSKFHETVEAWDKAHPKREEKHEGKDR
jgi:hypothetical protein